MVKEVVELSDIEKSKTELYQADGSGTDNSVAFEPKTGNKPQKLDMKDEKKMDLPPDSDSDDDMDYREHVYLKCGDVVARGRKALYSKVVKRKKFFKIIFYLCLLAAYLVYFGFSMNYSFGDEGSLRLLCGTIFIILLIVWSLTGSRIKEDFSTHVNCKTLTSPRFRRGLRWCLYVAATIFTISYLAIVILRKAPGNAMSLAGLVFFVVVGFFFSRRPDMVNWHVVFWGLMTQFFLALFILRTQAGYDLFNWLGTRVKEFIAHVDKGSIFAFGTTYKDHNFAFNAMPKVIFLNSTITVLYHFGIIQAFVDTFGRFLYFCMGTSPVESVNAAVNLFLGPSSAPLAIKPFLPLLTSSELHAIMAAGFASISGTAFGLIVSLGASPDNLLAASVMSAPAALAMSKLLVPETRWTRVKPNDAYTVSVAHHRNFLEAIAIGAVEGIKLVGSILVNQIVFVAAVDFIDQTLLWFGDRVGVPDVTFALLCSYFFYPLSFLMGFPSQDLLKIGELMGIKVFAHSITGFAEYGKLVQNRIDLENYISTYNGSWHYVNKDILLVDTNTTLFGGTLTRRSEVMGVYAFCGLNHIGAIGVTMGALLALIPHRKSTISKYAVPANITGHIASFMTACIAGLLYQETML